MSSPAPSDLKPLEHTYQSGESAEHVIRCNCNELIESPKTDQQHHLHHHHNVITSNTCHVHPINQVHVHVHASPKTGGENTAPKVLPSCTCHLQQNNNSNSDDQSHDHNHHHLNNVRKMEVDDRIEISPLPPALPPRPPPRPRFEGTFNARYRSDIASTGGGRIRKYVFWCCACGGLATILGALFLAVYFLLRSYTSTLGYFETIPTFVPATMLILTGLCVMSLARRKNRYSYLLKVCGLCCLVCALTCVLVTITTTVIHMNRLQTLRECVYTQKTKTCTCYSVLLEAHPQTDDGMRFVFDSTPDCEVIHGALYTCLRAMFGLSVSGILVCIFSCMLVYQLLSHERKKMYWEQLELRCRSFYQQQSGPPASAASSMRGPPMPPATYCSCCDECRYPTIATPQIYPWDAERFWAPPGRVGNFYSPNPGEELQPNDNQIPATGWNWRRLPWSRNPPQESQRDNSLTYQGIASSADSQYGFSNRSGEETHNPVSSTGSYSVLDSRPVGPGGVYVWGPPPPYSNPNSPARRPVHSPVRYHHIHHHHHPHETHCQMNEESLRNLQDFQREIRERRSRHKDNYENTVNGEVESHNPESEHTDTSSCADRVSHTLPVRKTKKRSMDISSVKSVTPAANCRMNVKNVFQEEPKEEEHKYHEPNLAPSDIKNDDSCRFLPRLQGVENAAFQKQETTPEKAEPTESEVYFADVSSCCNISVRNDGPDSPFYEEAVEGQSGRLISLQKPTELVAEEYFKNKARNRLPFPLPGDECSLTKDISSNSLSSSVRTPITETTDDCVTPSGDSTCLPYSEDSFLAPDAQYEVIQENNSPSNASGSYRSTCNLTNTISGLDYSQNYFVPKSPSKNSINVSPKRNVGSNISNLIKNLGNNSGGLLYNEANSGEEEETRGLSSHSDVTVDSGWQSGSDKTDKLEIQKPVNV